MKNPQFNLAAGTFLNRNPNKPVIEVVRSGPQTYIWIGNGEMTDQACFATLEGSAQLRKLCQAILSGLDGKE